MYVSEERVESGEKVIGDVTHTGRWKMPCVAKWLCYSQGKLWKNVIMATDRSHLEIQSFSLSYFEELNYSSRHNFISEEENN